MGNKLKTYEKMTGYAIAWTHLDVVGEVCAPKVSTTQHKLSGDRIQTPAPHGTCGFRMLT